MPSPWFQSLYEHVLIRYEVDTGPRYIIGNAGCSYGFWFKQWWFHNCVVVLADISQQLTTAHASMYRSVSAWVHCLQDKYKKIFCRDGFLPSDCAPANDCVLIGNLESKGGSDVSVMGNPAMNYKSDYGITAICSACIFEDHGGLKSLISENIHWTSLQSIQSLDLFSPCRCLTALVYFPAKNALPQSATHLSMWQMPLTEASRWRPLDHAWKNILSNTLLILDANSFDYSTFMFSSYSDGLYAHTHNKLCLIHAACMFVIELITRLCNILLTFALRVLDLG